MAFDLCITKLNHSFPSMATIVQTSGGRLALMADKKASKPLVSDEEKDAFKARLREAIGLSGVEPLGNDLAHELAIASQMTYTGIKAAVDLDGKTKSLNAKSNALLARHLKVDAHWLATGEGSKLSTAVWPFDKLTPEQYFSVRKELRDFAEMSLVPHVQDRRDDLGELGRLMGDGTNGR